MKSIVEGSIWDSERGRARASRRVREGPLGLLHGLKPQFHQVPKDSVSCLPSIIRICTAGGIPTPLPVFREPSYYEWTEVRPCRS